MSTRPETALELANRARRAIESLDGGLEAVDNGHSRGYDEVVRALRLLLTTGDGTRSQALGDGRRGHRHLAPFALSVLSWRWRASECRTTEGR